MQTGLPPEVSHKDCSESGTDLQLRSSPTSPNLVAPIQSLPSFWDCVCETHLMMSHYKQPAIDQLTSKHEVQIGTWLGLSNHDVLWIDKGHRSNTCPPHLKRRADGSGLLNLNWLFRVLNLGKTIHLWIRDCRQIHNHRGAHSWRLSLLHVQYSRRTAEVAVPSWRGTWHSRGMLLLGISHHRGTGYIAVPHCRRTWHSTGVLFLHVSDCSRAGYIGVPRWRGTWNFWIINCGGTMYLTVPHSGGTGCRRVPQCLTAPHFSGSGEQCIPVQGNTKLATFQHSLIGTWCHPLPSIPRRHTCSVTSCSVRLLRGAHRSWRSTWSTKCHLTVT